MDLTLIDACFLDNCPLARSELIRASSLSDSSLFIYLPLGERERWPVKEEWD